MAYVESVLRGDLDFRPTSRLKTETTIIEKLKRETIRLSQMHDIAGLRVVEDVDLREQDELAHAIARALPDTRVVDRREQPSYGYRALHVIARVDGFAVEVQVRTDLQDLWAQFVESLADRIGRGIRYGEMPSGAAQRRLVAGAMKLSDGLAEIERGKLDLRRIGEERAALASAIEADLVRIESKVVRLARTERGRLALAAWWQLARVRWIKRTLAREDRRLRRDQRRLDELERSTKEQFSALIEEVQGIEG